MVGVDCRLQSRNTNIVPDFVLDGAKIRACQFLKLTSYNFEERKGQDSCFRLTKRWNEQLSLQTLDSFDEIFQHLLVNI